MSLEELILFPLFVLFGGRAGSERIGLHDHLCQSLRIRFHPCLIVPKVLVYLVRHFLAVQSVLHSLVSVHQVLNDQPTASQNLEIALGNHGNRAGGVVVQVFLREVLLLERIKLTEFILDSC